MSLRLEAVTRRFGAQTALDAVSLHVRSGDCYGFLGHNGAGKTTALRIALGLDRADEGRVIVDGFDAAQHPREARARLGGLVETPGFHGHLSGTANLVLLARLQGLDRAAARTEAARVLGLVGLGDVGAKPVRVYSQGMRQRLGIAQAILGRPRVVLLDEPTNGLDPEGIEEMRRLLAGLTRDEGMTVLLSSHQLHEISGACTRIGILRQGRLLVEEETSKLLGDGAGRYALATGDDAAAARVLAESKVSAHADERGGLVVDLGARPPGDVARALVERGVEIRAFAPRPTTLEDVYLRFARGGPAQTNGSTTSDSVVVAVEPAQRLAPSSAIRRVFRYDAARWMSTAAVPAMLAASALVAVGAVWNRRAAATGHAGDVAAGTVFSTGTVTAFEGFGVALAAATPILAAIVALIASQSAAGELARGTLRNVLLRPLTRLDAAWGKFAALAAAGVAAYALLAGVGIAAAASSFKFEARYEILPNGVRIPLDGKTPDVMWPELFHALWSPLPALLAFAGIGFAAGALVRTGAAAMALALACLVSFEFLRAVGRSFGFEGWLPTAHLPAFVGDTSFVQYYVQESQGISNASDPYASLHVVVPFAWAAATFALAAWLLRRRSIP